MAIGPTLYLLIALLSVANGIVMLVINPGRTINRIFFFASAWIALWFACVCMAIWEGALYTSGPADNIILWVRLSSAVAAFMGWIVWLMRFALLTPDGSIHDMFRASWLWFGVSCLIAGVAFSETFVPSDSTPLVSKRGVGYYIYSAAIVSSCIYFLYDTLQAMRYLSGARKIEMQFFVCNTICACLVIVCLNLVGALLQLPWVRRIGPLGFIVLHALTVWAISSHKVFDAKQVVSSIGQRVMFLGLVGFVAVVIMTSLEGYVNRPYDVLSATLLTGVCALLLERPTRKWFGLDPDSLLERPRRDIVERARSESDAEKLKLQFELILREWCQASGVDILFRKEQVFAGTQLRLPGSDVVVQALTKSGWITPESLQRKRPDGSTADCLRWMTERRCGALLAVPRGSDRPSLIVAFGQRESLRPYTYPDIQLLISLAELTDNILTHATLAQQAVKLARMESATMMSRSLAHDLRNLTTPIAAYLVHADGRAIPGSQEAEVYNAARLSIKVMDDFIRESLFFARRHAPEIQELNPRDALVSVIGLSHAHAAAKQVTLCLECDEVLSMSVDRALFERLAANLVHNAIDASMPGGVVCVSCGQRFEKVFLRVADRGSGISSENMRHIFDPYFSTKNTGDTHRGLGLGLAICRKIMDLHDGEIRAESHPGQGAVFTALFPAKPSLAGSGPSQRRPSGLLDLISDDPLVPSPLDVARTSV